MNNFQVSDNFNLREFQCKGADCCHGSVKISNRLVKILQNIRKTVDTPLYVLSGYRCPAHNARVGGAPRSYHMRGEAADIAGNVDIDRLADIAGRCGGVGIGTYRNSGFIHVDIRDGGMYKWEG